MIKFLIDAQIPRRIKYRLQEVGCDVIHTLDLPDKNATPDSEVNKISIGEERVVITKDTDFVNTFIMDGIPFKLLLISTGNIPNPELERIFVSNLDEIIKGFESHSFIELDSEMITYHF